MASCKILTNGIVWAISLLAMQTLCAGGEVPAVTGSAATARAIDSGPRIYFPAPIHDCGETKVGATVKYSFIFTNTGDQPLEVRTVRPGCGCATAGEWTRRVMPGNPGVIPIQLTTDMDWPSGPFDKTVTADSNDPRQPAAMLHLAGILWKPIDVTPQFAAFNIPADSPVPVSTVVRILNHTQEKISLSPPEIDNPAFTAELKTNEPGKDFQLIITARPPFTAGSLSGQLRLKTSSGVLPEIGVPIMANVLPVIVVLPSQLTLPAPPLGRRATPAFTIQYNGNNALTLSEAAVDARGVAIAITEARPGHTFTVKLTFPQSFTIPRGETAMFSVKTSYPGVPLIKVPIHQIPAMGGRN